MLMCVWQGMKQQQRLFLAFRLALVSIVAIDHVHSSFDRPCARRIIANDQTRIVCVCNATYCDDVDPIGMLASNEAAIYATSLSGKRLDRSDAEWQLGKVDDKSAVKVFVNVGRQYQSMLGFGGAVTDAAGVNVYSLSANARQNLLQSYYGNNGIQYSMGRVPMASCDFSTHEYSYDDVDGDFNLTNFALTTEDLQLKIPMIQQALQLTGGDLKLFGSPWSAPGWMKTNGHMNGSGTLKGDQTSQYHKTWANYYVRFLDAYYANNVTIWGLTVQNEPNANNPWQEMSYTMEMERDFVKNTLGPTLIRSTIGRNVKLMSMDDCMWFLPNWTTTAFGDADAAQYLSGVALHWYCPCDDAASRLNQTYHMHPDKFILATEACEYWDDVNQVLGPKPGAWERAENYARNIFEDVNNHVSGWVDWNMALDMRGGPNWVNNFVDSPILVDANADEFIKNPMFYAMGHFSKFVRPNYKRIELQIGDQENLEGSAFVSDNNQQRVLIMRNSHETSSYNLCVEDAERIGQVLNISIEPKSIISLVWTTSSSTKSEGFALTAMSMIASFIVALVSLL